MVAEESMVVLYSWNGGRKVEQHSLWGIWAEQGFGALWYNGVLSRAWWKSMVPEHGVRKIRKVLSVGHIGRVGHSGKLEHIGTASMVVWGHCQSGMGHGGRVEHCGLVVF